MTNLENEEPINRRLEHDRPGRSFIAVDSSRWGELILPSPEEAAPHPDHHEALRIVAVTSFYFGLEVLKALLDFERSHPDLVNMIAVATDDAINADAKISLKKRIWKYYTQAERIEAETATIEAALTAGVPVYTGEMKIEWFHRQLAEWRPDVIIVCGCGQIFDFEILDEPRFGIYNLHPSDLAHGHGAGAQPYEDSVAREDPFTRWTVHRMTREIDAGPIIGSSPSICVAGPDGRITPDPKQYYEKLRQAVPSLIPPLLNELVHLQKQNPDPTPSYLAPINFPEHFPKTLKTHLTEPLP